ncbi:MAG: S49 family peptidase [Candidatus Solibacter sp.]|nr:S49 family peptidase [Candidatus Solibacter sp.]
MNQKYLPHLAARVFGVPLMIQPDKLMVILDAIGPRIGLPEHLLIEGMPVVVTRPAPDDTEEEDLLMTAGRKAYPVSPDGIAIITISGTLVKKASWMDSESGLSSYGDIRTMLADARDDPAIRGILLDVDSPGGEVGGLFDLADEVYAVREQKPCYAIANDDAFSAAYALASCAQRLFVTRTGGVGSIGVIAVHMDQSGWDEKMGRKYTAVFAGARKNDYSTHQPLSDAARANLQDEIDRLHEMFVASVARGRGISPALVRKTDASIYWGATAISAGLADQIGTFDDALAAVTQASRMSRQARATASAGAQIEEQGEEPMAQTPETKPADAPAIPVAAPVETQPQAAPAPAPAPAATAPVPEAAATPFVDAAAIEARVRGEHAIVQDAKVALCKTAGRLDLLPEMLSPSLTVAQVGDRLLAAQSQRSQAAPLNSQITATPTGAEGQLNSAATQIAAGRQITFAQAYVEALKLNPALYTQYLDEKSAPVVPR